MRLLTNISWTLRRLPPTLGLALISLIAWVACSTSPEAPASTAESPTGNLDLDPLPNELAGLSLASLDGETVELQNYTGQIVILNFWATWCGPCRVEMPELQAYYDAHHDDGFVLLAINREETPQQARAFIEEMGYTFPVLLDQNGDLYRHFLLRTMPASIVFDARGQLIFQHNGLVNQAFLEEQVTPLLPTE